MRSVISVDVVLGQIFVDQFAAMTLYNKLARHRLIERRSERFVIANFDVDRILTRKGWREGTVANVRQKVSACCRYVSSVRFK